MTSRTRQTVNRSIVLVAVAAAAGLALGGCKIQVGNDSPKAAGSPAPVTVATPSPSHSSPAPAGGKSSSSPRASKSGSGNGNLPDVCALLSRAEVSSLAGGKSITQVDPSGPGEGSRYCQWQLAGARVLVAVQHSTRAQFDTTSPEARTVDGVGDAAFTLGGHLYVYTSGLSVDIYTSSGTDAAGELRLEKQFAAKVLPRL